MDEINLVNELQNLKQKIQLLEDKEEIRDLLCRYCYNADLGRNDNYVQLFTEDGAFDLWKLDFASLSVFKKDKSKETFNLSTVPLLISCVDLNPN